MYRFSLNNNVLISLLILFIFNINLSFSQNISIWQPIKECTESDPCQFEDVQNWKDGLAPWLDSSYDTSIEITGQKQYININQSLDLGGLSLVGPVQLVVSQQVVFNRFVQLNLTTLTATNESSPIYFNGGIATDSSTVLDLVSASFSNNKVQSTVSSLYGDYIVIDNATLSITNLLSVSNSFVVYPKASVNVKCQNSVNITLVEQSENSQLSISSSTGSIFIANANTNGDFILSDTKQVNIQGGFFTALSLTGSISLTMHSVEINNLLTINSKSIDVTLSGNNKVRSTSEVPLENIVITTTPGSFTDFGSEFDLSTASSSITFNGNAAGILPKMSAKSIVLTNSSEFSTRNTPSITADLTIDVNSKFTNVPDNQLSLVGSIYLKSGYLSAYSPVSVSNALQVDSGELVLSANNVISVGKILTLSSKSKTTLLTSQNSTNNFNGTFMVVDNVVLDGAIVLQFDANTTIEKEYPCVIIANSIQINSNAKTSVSIGSEVSTAEYKAYASKSNSGKQCITISTKTPSHNSAVSIQKLSSITIIVIIMSILLIL